LQTSGDIFGFLGDPRKSHARRSGMEIVCDVLQVLSDGSFKPTHILSKANVSWQVLTSSLDFLVKNGMVTEVRDEERTVYTLTESGKAILQLYDALKSAMAGEFDEPPGRVAAEYPARQTAPAEEGPVAWRQRVRSHPVF
jgi:predicted transcriptional regulator